MARDGAADVECVVPAKLDPLQPTIFHEPWWLEAATAGAYEEVEVRASGRVVGRLPYVWTRMHGHRACTLPSLTHVLGPAVVAGGAPANAAIRRTAILEELVGRLPRAEHVFQRLHRGLTDTIAFQDLGYTTGVQFSFEIAPQPEEAIWRAMRDKTRNVIRRAQDTGEAERGLDAGAFVDFYRRTLVEKGLRNYYDTTTLAAALSCAVDRGRAEIYAKRGAARELTAAACVLHDAQSSYYFLSARRPGASNGCVSQLVWESLRDSARAGRLFDFEGANTRGSALFYTAFGAQASPRYTVTKSSDVFRLSRLIQTSLHRTPWRGPSVGARSPAFGRGAPAAGPTPAP